MLKQLKVEKNQKHVSRSQKLKAWKKGHQEDFWSFFIRNELHGNSAEAST